MCDKDEIVVEATIENLDEVLKFVQEHLENADCPLGVQNKIEIAVEEIFSNITNYAYAPETGNAILRFEVSHNPTEITIAFIDHGIPFDPLAKDDPDVSLPAKQRKIGGLGIYIVKNFMDDVFYEYRDGQNILTLKKTIGE